MGYKDLYDRFEETNDLNKSWERTEKARQQRKRKLKNRINYIIECTDYPYFITYTLNDKNKDLKKDTFKKRIRESLRYNNVDYYVGNEDYGSKNGRLHFHFVCGFNDKITKKDIEKYYQFGFIDIKPIKNRNKTEAIQLYITKLVNHGVKENTGKLIYMRKTY